MVGERSPRVLGVVAGGGALPKIVASAAREGTAYDRVVVAQIADGVEDDWSGFEARCFDWGRVGDAIVHMRSRGVETLVVCGTVSRRPDFRSLVPSLRTLQMMPALFAIVRGGDDRLLKNVDRYLKKRGFDLIGVQDVVPELLAPPGSITRRPPSADERAALLLAMRAARRLGELDVGQAVVASAERVIALEAIEGTRDMLRRVAEFRRQKRIGRSERCVLVKAVKPHQDERFDLPSIGTATVDEAIDAGVSAIGVTAGKSLIIGFDDVVDRADAHSLAIAGLDASWETAP